MPTSPFPMIRATILLDMQPANVQDVNTLWLRGGSGPVAILATATDATTTTFVFQAPALPSIVGKTLLFDNEPVSVTALSMDGLTATVSRYVDAFPFMALLPFPPTTTHTVGTGGMQLSYNDPWTFIAQKYLRPSFQADINNLGELSASFGTLASGSLALAPTS